MPSSYNRELEEIDRIIAESPDSALAELNRISPDSLSEPDRNLYNLLSIKAADKAYVRHTSDSLILQVIDYYDRHKNDPRYPEALYYGGRVYSDIGDLPTALKYFQSALDRLPEGTENLRLRSSALSQMGRLLYSLYLNEDAESYLLQAIQTDSLISDKFNLAYDYHLLGSILLRLKNYRSALSSFEKARVWASHISAEDEAVMNVYKAATLHRMNRPEAALKLIRRLPERFLPDFKNVAYATAAEIFLDAGICDTAALYARKLVNSNVEDNKKTGYKILLSDELRNLIPPDSIPYYYSSYKKILDEVNADRGNQEAIVQQSMYNYNLHERSLQQERNSNRTYGICAAAFVVILICIFVAMFFLIRHKNSRENRYVSNELHNQDINFGNCREDKVEDNSPTGSIDSIIPREKGFEPIDKEKLLQKAIDPTICHELSQKMALSIPYRILMQNIQEKKVIPEDSDFWQLIQKAIEEESPSFTSNLMWLLGGKVKTPDLHTALLIKCNVTPTQMTWLFGKSAGAISSRRESMSVRIFGKNVGNATIDNVIKCL